MSIDLRSPAFAPGEPMPEVSGRDGGNAAPPLEWSGVPGGTRELVLTVTDPDAPNGTFVHWIVAGIDPQRDRLDEEIAGRCTQGRNGFGTIGYDGPQPPVGDEAHWYVFRLLALDDTSDVGPGVTIDQLHDAVQGKVTAEAELVGRYELPFGSAY